MAVNSLFCRHNRFTADCPICSKGTVLDPNRSAARSRPASAAGAGRSRGAGAAAGAVAARFTGPYASAGSYRDDSGDAYEVRLERVPGGVRLAEWAAGQIRRSAPVLQAGDLRRLIGEVTERQLLPERDVAALAAAIAADPEGRGPHGSSRGRSGDMQEELRIERVAENRLRVGRWILRPGAGWELQEAPVMLPAIRYAEAIRGAAAAGLLGD
jgi:hypothetical protein